VGEEGHDDGDEQGIAVKMFFVVQRQSLADIGLSAFDVFCFTRFDFTSRHFLYRVFNLGYIQKHFSSDSFMQHSPFM
jgi:hypothetical protein